jgi:hypothetical protein
MSLPPHRPPKGKVAENGTKETAISPNNQFRRPLERLLKVPNSELLDKQKAYSDRLGQEKIQPKIL